MEHINSKGSFSDTTTKQTFIKKTYSWLIYDQDNYLGSCNRPERWIAHTIQKPRFKNRNSARLENTNYGKRIV